MDKLLINRHIQECIQKAQRQKNYQGLLTVARNIAISYYNFYHKKDFEYSFFVLLKLEKLTFDIMFRLANKTLYKLDFEGKLKKYENYLKEIKEVIYLRWVNNTLPEKLKQKREKIKRLKTSIYKDNLISYCKMLENLIDKYPTFKTEHSKEFKEDIGLC